MMNNSNTLTLEILYRDGANYKIRFDHIVNLEEYPEAKDLKIGDEFEMGEFGTKTQSEFFEEHPYDDEFDHNILEIENIIIL